MLLDPMTTWSLVRISPVELMIMPVPAALPLPRVVLTLTMAGLTLAATASVVASVPFDGGSKLWSGGVSGPCSDPPGFCSDIFDLPPLATWNSDVVLRGCARDLGTDSMNP